MGFSPIAVEELSRVLLQARMERLISSLWWERSLCREILRRGAVGTLSGKGEKSVQVVVVVVVLLLLLLL